MTTVNSGCPGINRMSAGVVSSGAWAAGAACTLAAAMAPAGAHVTAAAVGAVVPPAGSAALAR